MRRILLALIFIIAGIAAIDAAAAGKTITVKVDDPAHVTVRNPGDGYNTVTFDAQNSATIELEYPAPVEAASGWQIAQIALADGGTATMVALPATSASISPDLVPEGATVYITTEEKEMQVFTVIADDPSHISRVAYDYNDVAPADGVWKFPITNPYGYFDIIPAEDFAITGLKDSEGNDIQYYGTYPSIYVGQFSTSMTFHVSTKSKADMRTSSLTVNLEGNPDELNLRRADGTQINLTEGAQTIAYDPQTEVPFSLSHNSYGKSIFKVELNGEKLTPDYGSYTIYPIDGGMLAITVDYPDVEVPVSITWDAANEGIVKSVMANGENIDPAVWNSSDFKLKAGSSLYIDCDYASFTGISYLVNGNYSQLPIVIDAIEGYEIKVEGTPLEDKTITVYCGDWENLCMDINGDIVNMTGVETTVKVPGSVSSFKFSGLNDYLIAGIFNYDTNEPVQNYGGYVYGFEDGMKYLVELELYERNETAVFRLSDGFDSARLVFGSGDTYTEINLQEGFNKVNFNKDDLPFNLYAYTSSYTPASVYINGSLAENNYGTISGFDAIENGDVVMIYDREVEPLHVSLQISTESKVDVVANLMQEISAPADFEALPGTMLQIYGAGIAVKANGEELPSELQPNEDLVWTYIIDKDSEIIITDAAGNAVAVIGNDATDCNVYRLDGTLAAKNATASEIKSLPSGIYIFKGAKLIVK